MSTSKLLTAKPIAKEIYSQIKEFLINDSKDKSQKNKVKLCVILVGNDPASEIYVNHKISSCKALNIQCEVIHKKNPQNLTHHHLRTLIHKLNIDTTVHGIILQLPIADHLEPYKIIKEICPYKDVDGLTIYNQGALSLKQECHVPCTALGCYKMLEYYNYLQTGLHIVIIGNSPLVGSSLARLLLHNGCCVTTITKNSRNPEIICKNADILVVACGKCKLVDVNWVHKDCVVLDVGIHRTNDGKICGDTNFENLKGIVKAITPVPGGIGPLTVAMLIKNLISAYDYLENGKKLSKPPQHKEGIPT